MFALQYVLLVSFLVPPPAPLHVGPATTYLTAPLNADGTVNYVAALNAEASKDLKPADNAAVGLAKALGPAALDGRVRAETLKALGLADLPETGDYFVTFKDFEAKEGRQEERPVKDDGSQVTDLVFEIAAVRPWSAKEFPVIADWLKANEKPLDLATKAAQCKRYFMPAVSPSTPPRMVDVLVSNLGHLRTITNALAARAMLRIDGGDNNGAAADALTILRLGRLLTQDHTLIAHLVGYAIEAGGQEAVFQLIGSGKLSSKEARQLLADIDALPARRQPVAAFRAERLMGLDCVVGLYSQGPGAFANMGLALPAAAGAAQYPWVVNTVMDPNIILRRLNAMYDKLDQAAAKPTYAARAEAMTAFEVDLRAQRVDASSAVTSPATWMLVILLPAELRRTVTSLTIGNLLVGMIVPALGAVNKTHAKVEMRTDLVRVALALAAYRADKGQYPDKLGDLAPQYLAKIPGDIFNDKPLGYVKDGEACVVFSVGPDLKEAGDEKNKLVVRLATPAN